MVLPVNEGETIQVGVSRKRKSSSRRSSILKAQKSPTRAVLSDLDPNTKEENEFGVAKKSRRSMRRVSFAETNQVKEFLKDSLWNSGQNGPDAQDQRISNTVNVSASGVPGDDGSHGIEGLDTLLTGTIQNVVPIEQQSGPPGSDTAGSQAVNVTRRESVGMDMTSCYSSQTGAQFMQPSSSMDTATFLQQYFEKSENSPSDETILFGKNQQSNDMELTCNMSSGMIDTRSFLQSLTGESKPAERAPEKTVIFNQTGKSQTLDLTCASCEDQVNITAKASQPVKKQGRQSVSSPLEVTTLSDTILEKYIGKTHFMPNDDQTSRFTDNNADMEMTACHSAQLQSQDSAKKIDALSFLSALNATNQSQEDQTTVVGEKTRCFNNDEETAAMEMTACHSAVLQQMAPQSMNGGRKGQLQNVTPVKKIDALSFLSLLQDQNSAFESEKTRCFDKDEETAAMEFTACHNNILQQEEPCSQKSHSETPVRKIDALSFLSSLREQTSVWDSEKTRCFDKDEETAAMEMTACHTANLHQVEPHIKANQSGQPKSDTPVKKIDALSFLSTLKQQDSVLNSEKTRCFSKDEDTAAMEFTACHDNILSQVAPSQQHLAESTHVFPSSKNPLSSLGQGPSSLADLSAVEPTVDSTQRLLNLQVGNVTGGQNEKSNIPGDYTIGVGGSTTRIQAFADQVMGDLTEKSVRGGNTTSLGGNTEKIMAFADKVLQRETVSGGQGEITRRFNDDDQTAAMEMTECVQLQRARYSLPPKEGAANTSRLYGQGNNTTSLGSNTEKIMAFADKVLQKETEVHGEITRRFNDNDQTAAMEMTECMQPLSANYSLPSKEKGNATTLGGNTEKIMAFADKVLQRKDVSVDQGEITRRFNSDDQTAAMEMTECIPPLSANYSLILKEKGNATTLGGNTEKIMAFADKVLQRETVSVDQGEMTRRFNNDDQTAAMEMTECVRPESTSYLLPPKEGAMNASRHYGQGRNTTIGGNTEKIIAFADKVLNDETSVGNEGEHTKRFNEGDNNAAMELTECVRPVSVSSSLPKPGGAANATAHYGDDMEFTKCITASIKSGVERLSEPDITLPSAPYPKRDLQPSSEQSKHGNKTHIFASEDTAAMDFTECLLNEQVPSSNFHADNEEVSGGGIELAACAQGLDRSVHEDQPKSTRMSFLQQKLENLNKSLQKENRLPQRKADDDKTVVFGSEDGDGLEMTTAVGGILSSQGVEEKTKIFSSGKDDCSLEYTKCSGGILDQQSLLTFSKSNSSKMNKTQLFSNQEQTANIDFTTCVGGILPAKEGDSKSVLDASALVKVGNRVAAVGEKTRIFDDQTEGMELTLCATRNLSAGAVEENKRPVTSGEKTQIFSEGKTERMDLTMCTSGDLEISTGISSPGKRITTDAASTGLVMNKHDDLGNKTKLFSEDQTEGMEFTTCTGGVDMSLLPSDNLSSSPTALEVEEIEEFLPNKVESKDQATKATSLTMVGDNSEQQMQLDVPQESVRNEEGDVQEFMEKSEASPDHHDTSAEVFKKPDVFATSLRQRHTSQLSTASECALLDEPTPLEMLDCSSSIDASGLGHKTGALSETLMGQSTCSSPLSKSMLSLIDEKSMSSMSVKHEGPYSMDEFLEHLSIREHQFHHKRRSTVVPVSVAPPSCLSDYLNLSLVVEPQVRSYDWACNYMSGHMDNLRSAIDEIETDILENNPPLFEEVIKGPPEKMKEWKQRVKSMMQACNKTSKRNFKEWRAKMLQKLLEALKVSEAGLTKSVKQMEDHIKDIDDAQAHLDSVEEALDKKLEELDQESGEEMEEDIDTEEAAAKRAILDHLQKYCVGLAEEMAVESEREEGCVAERQQLEAQVKQLKGQVSEQEDVQETVATLERRIQEAQSRTSAGNDQEQEDLEDKLHRVNSYYTEWVLVEASEQLLEFSFLEDTLCVNISLGSQLCHLQGVLENHPRSLESIDIVPIQREKPLSWDDLIQDLVMSALDKTELLLKYRTTTDLRQLLQEISLVVQDCRHLAREIQRCALRHILTIENNRVQVEFSSLKAFSCFTVDFSFVPGTYPKKVLDHKITVSIGEISGERIQEALDDVAPGLNYFTRLCSAADQLLLSAPRQ